MFKKGFTLQELLITMAIIGVVAAITAPALIKIVPDENKVKYMKAYNTLSRLVPEILDDPLYYSPQRDNNGNEYQGLSQSLDCCGNTQNHLENNDNVPSGLRTSLLSACANGLENEEKFPRIFAYNLNLQDDVEFYEGGYSGINKSVVYFKTIDGISWLFTYDNNGINNSNHILYVDVDDSENSPNAVFSANVQNPDRFIFKIDNYGGITAVDAMGRAYLQNSTNMHAKDQDKAAAATIYKQILADQTKNDN